MAEQDIQRALDGITSSASLLKAFSTDEISETAQQELAFAADLIASLRQELAEARKRARREALEEAANLIEANSFHKTADGYVLEPRMQGDRYGLAYATAILALPHPDREGERLSETETAARIVDTQAQYYAGHNQTIAKAIAKALREAAGAIRAQSQPRPRREGERG